MHGSDMGMGNAFGDRLLRHGLVLCRASTKRLSALLTDLDERGLLESTLVVVMGEFGRTPQINTASANPGRQHWPICWSAILAGGGIRGGQVYGESDKHRRLRQGPPGAPAGPRRHDLPRPGRATDLRQSKDGQFRLLSQGEPLLSLFS